MGISDGLARPDPTARSSLCFFGPLVGDPRSRICAFCLVAWNTQKAFQARRGLSRQYISMEIITKKLHLVPYNPSAKPKDERTTHVTVNRKNGLIAFGGPALADLQMKGKLIRFYSDQTKNIIAWQVREGGSLDEIRGWRLCKENPQNGNWVTTIKGIVESFQGLTKDSYKKLPIKKYQIKQGDSILENGSEYYFVELIDHEQE